MSEHAKNCSCNQKSASSSIHPLAVFLAGAAAGAITALLTARRSGAEMRAKIRQAASRSKETAERMPQAIVEATDAARTAFHSALSESQACALENNRETTGNQQSR